MKGRCEVSCRQSCLIFFFFFYVLPFQTLNTGCAAKWSNLPEAGPFPSRHTVKGLCQESGGIMKTKDRYFAIFRPGCIILHYNLCMPRLQ